MAYIIQTAAAQMPSSCSGRYRRVAVLEVDDGVERVSSISTRAKGVRRVVKTWEKLSVGSTSNCAYERALAEARAMVAALAEDHEVDGTGIPWSHEQA